MDTFIRNTETGEIHRLRYGHLSDERCNVDSLRDSRRGRRYTGHAQEISEEEARASIKDMPWHACLWCVSAGFGADN